jgi:hypothetical protein
LDFVNTGRNLVDNDPIPNHFITISLRLFALKLSWLSMEIRNRKFSEIFPVVQETLGKFEIGRDRIEEPDVTAILDLAMSHFLTSLRMNAFDNIVFL